jgi:hypothetical protein
MSGTLMAEIKQCVQREKIKSRLPIMSKQRQYLENCFKPIFGNLRLGIKSH